MLSEFNLHPIKRDTVQSTFLSGKVTSLSGGLTHTKEGAEFTANHFKDSLIDPNAHKGYLHARGELLFRIDGLKKKGGFDNEIYAMKKREASLKKSQESIEQLKPETWYGKLRKALTTMRHGIFDSITSFLTRHPTVASFLDPSW